MYFVYRTGKSRWMKWLSFAPVVFLGKISYGLYVYHLLGIYLGFMVVKKLTILAGIFHSNNLAFFIVSLCITVAAAIGSYQLIEKPFLKYKKRFEIIASRPA